ncbi:MAG: EAL domain-containing protein, partial [Thermomicrobiaceae bacterium]|nr:EAL domain-containing protein [Thermomicrobiaceae bacterium]
PNRALLLDELAHALARARRHGRQLAVLFLDLDNFKLVNDSLGHETGDRLLVAVAERLRGCLRASDIAARLGGDEFTVVLEEVRDPADATRLAERVLEALRGPYAVGAQEVFVTPSIGIVLSRDGEERPEDLLRDADVAMYRAKRRGKARVELFDPRMNQEVQARLQLESDLRRAIERGEFLLHYQPQVQLPAGWIVGFEALLRWRHPRRGLVPPGEFIPIAEETGLIVPLGAWVLEEACRQARAWTDAIPSAADLVVSVNLSSRQFQQPDLVARVRDTLGRTGLSPRNLAIEITESAVMEDVEGAVATLQALAALGVQLMIDDFGTGYSSLSYLKRFPVHALKIDRSFVDGLGAEIEDTVISSAVVGLARALDLKVIAEGVESSAQVAHLQAMDCDRAQGYLFAPPIPAERVEGLLRQQAATGQGIGAGSVPSPPQLRLV